MPLEIYEYDSGNDYIIWKGADPNYTVFVWKNRHSTITRRCK